MSKILLPIWRRVTQLFAREILGEIYLGVLARDPDSDGIAKYLVGTRLAGRPAAIIRGLLRGEEFRENYLRFLTPDIARKSYLRILGREPDSVELDAFKVKLAQNENLDGALSELIRSEEFRLKGLARLLPDVVTADDKELLDRGPDPNGEQVHDASPSATGNLTASISGSDKFQQRAPLRETTSKMRFRFWRWYTQLFARDILREIYIGILARNPDGVEITKHVKEMRRAGGLAGIINDLLHSEEFRGKYFGFLAEDLARKSYLGILGREPNPAELEAFKIELIQERRFDGVLGKLLGSEEFQTKWREANLPKALVVIALEPASAERVHELVKAFVAYSSAVSRRPAVKLRVDLHVHHPLTEGTRSPQELRADIGTDSTQIIITHSDILSWMELMTTEPDSFTPIYIQPNVLRFGDLANDAVNFPSIRSRFYWRFVEYIDTALARRHVISAEEAFYRPQRIADTLRAHSVLKADHPDLTCVGAEKIESEYRKCLAVAFRPSDDEHSPLSALMPGFLPGKSYSVGAAPGLFALEDGWCSPEQEFAWSSGNRSTLILYVDCGESPLRLKLRGFVISGGWAARVLVNGVLARHVKLPSEAGRELTIEVDLTSSPDGVLSCFRIDLEFDNVVRPSDAGGGIKDSRQLSFALRSFELNVRVDANPGQKKGVEARRRLRGYDETISSAASNQSPLVPSLLKQLLGAGLEGCLIRTFGIAGYDRSLWLNRKRWMHCVQSALQLPIKSGTWVVDGISNDCSLQDAPADSNILTELNAMTLFGSVGQLVHAFLSSPDEASLIELWSPEAFLALSNSLGLPGNKVSRLPDIAMHAPAESRTSDELAVLWHWKKCLGHDLFREATMRIQASSFYVMQKLAGERNRRTDGTVIAVTQDGSLDFVVKADVASHGRTRPTISIIRSLLETSQPGTDEGGAKDRRRAFIIQMSDFATIDVASVAYGRSCGKMPTVRLIPDAYFFQQEGYRGIRDIASRNELPSWESRSETVCWRGSATTNYKSIMGEQVTRVELVPRVMMCEVLKDCKWADVAIMHPWDLPFDRVTERLVEMGIYRPKKNMLEHANYRYLIDIDGVANAWSFFEKMLLGSCILKIGSPYEQWFYDRIQPWKHFVPVKFDFSDLVEKSEWCLQNPDEARQIGAEAQRFALEHTYEVARQGAIEAIQSVTVDL